MKKLILFSILSVLLYSAPGHAEKKTAAVPKTALHLRFVVSAEEENAARARLLAAFQAAAAAIPVTPAVVTERIKEKEQKEQKEERERRSSSCLW